MKSTPWIGGKTQSLLFLVTSSYYIFLLSIDKYIYSTLKFYLSVKIKDEFLSVIFPGIL